MPATLLTACDLIDYHPYDGRLDSDTSREINPTNIERIEKVCEGKDTIRFIFMGDTQQHIRFPMIPVIIPTGTHG